MTERTGHVYDMKFVRSLRSFEVTHTKGDIVYISQTNFFKSRYSSSKCLCRRERESDVLAVEEPKTAEFEFLGLVSIKREAFWDMTPSTLVDV
jgi:hypothetical protein